MPVEITYGSGGEVSEPPPILFRHVRTYHGDDRYRYIMGELETMIDNGTLYLTDIFRQPSAVRDAVGLALKGKIVDTETLTERAAEVFDEDQRHKVLSHKVTIRCIPGRADSVAFKKAVVRDPRGRVLPGSRGVGQDHIGDGSVSFSKMAVANVDMFVDYKSPVAEVPIADAWVCLGRAGKRCRTADSQRLQEKYWLFEEVKKSSSNSQPDAQQGKRR